MNTIAHDTLLFNLHDLILLMAAGQYVLLAILLFFTRKETEKSSYLLAVFLVLNALHSVDTLIIWSEQLRQLALSWHPSLYFWGAIGFWLQGPLLYWYVSSVLYKDFRFTAKDALHLIPATFVALYLMTQYHALPNDTQVASMQNLQFMWQPVMGNITTWRYISVMFYGGWCLFALYRYRKQLRHQYANLDVSERGWLTWVVLGVALLSGWALIVHLIGNSISHSISNAMGLGGNYFEFIFVNSLVFTSIRYTHLFDGISRNDVTKRSELVTPDTNPQGHPQKKSHEALTSTQEDKGVTDEHITRIERFMREHKPHLDNQINLETLSVRLSIPERTLSKRLNQHFRKNFFEFINSYRIEEAKSDLLAHPKKPILEVLADAGFSSKSTFNSIFKQQVGMTPTQFRKNSGSTGQNEQ